MSRLLTMTSTTTAFDCSSSWLFGASPARRLRRTSLHLLHSMRITALLDTSRPVHLGFPHRLRPGTSPHALRIPPHGGHPALRSTASGSPASEAMNPAFGYSAPHLSARGTLTPLNNALLSAYFRLADYSGAMGPNRRIE